MTWKIVLFLIFLHSSQAYATVNDSCNIIANLAEDVMIKRQNGASKAQLMAEVQKLRIESEKSTNEEDHRHLADESGLTAMFTQEVFEKELYENNKMKKRAIKDYRSFVYKECMLANP
ncbi:hypothetical protein D3C78_51680 [compost metagenome]